MPSDRDAVFRPVLDRVDAIVAAHITRAVAEALRFVASRIELEAAPRAPRVASRGRRAPRAPRATPRRAAAPTPRRSGAGHASPAKLRALEIARARLAEKRAALARARAEAAEGT